LRAGIEGRGNIKTTALPLSFFFSLAGRGNPDKAFEQTPSSKKKLIK